MNNLAQVTRGKPAPLGHVTVHAAMRKALAAGGVPTSLLSVNWDIAGTGVLRCMYPVNRSMQAEQSTESKLFTNRWRPRQWLDLKVRCRSCYNCLRLRGHEWTQRAISEIKSAERTWFGTMTLASPMHMRSYYIARKAAARAGVDFDGLPPNEQFARRHRVISRWLTLWMKKVRKATRDKWDRDCKAVGQCPIDGPPRLRLMIVCERHQSGLPHYHCLVHESAAYATSERVLRKRWGFGHSTFRVVDETRTANAAWYMAKYLTKSSVARVRASLDYGNWNDVGSTGAQQEFPKHGLSPSRGTEDVNPRHKPEPASGSDRSLPYEQS